MQRSDRPSSQAGMTLIESMIAMALASVMMYGGYSMLTRTQKYLAFKDLNRGGRNEAAELTAVIKKDWDYRLRKPTAGVPATGFSVLTASNTPCTADCPKLKLWINRLVAGTTVTDEVLVENFCVRPDSGPVVTLAEKLDFQSTTLVNAACGLCPRGYLPAVRITGKDIRTSNAVLPAENRTFPNNIAASLRTNANNVRIPIKETDLLGMQACFAQNGANLPLSVDVRSIFIAQGTHDVSNETAQKMLQKIQNTEVFPYENFANIRLEQ